MIVKKSIFIYIVLNKGVYMRINSYNDLIKNVQKYKNEPKKIAKIKQNFSEYLQLCDEQNIMNFINEIKNIPEMKSTLYYNSDSICRRFGIGIILKMTQGMQFKERFEFIHEMYEGIRFKYYTIDEYVEDLMEYNEIEYICNNMNEIITLSDLDTLIELGILKKLKQLDSEKFSKINSSIVAKMTGIKQLFLDDKILLALTTIVNEVAQNENVDISDLEDIRNGTLTKVYKLGNKVVKFGKYRLTDRIPYHKRILQPLLRRQVLGGSRKLYIEIAEYVEPDNEITDEDAYLIYKELREEGIIWLDAKSENLGRLNKENIVYFNEPLNVKNESVGYITETIKDEEPLHKGELVIIDTDFLIREEEFDEKLLDKYINTNFYHICEKRYQEEKNTKKSKNIIDRLVSKLEGTMER